jgi:3-dehydroquinate dehydratase
MIATSVMAGFGAEGYPIAVKALLARLRT